LPIIGCQAVSGSSAHRRCNLSARRGSGRRLPLVASRLSQIERRKLTEMGFWRWAWKHSATRQLLVGPPKRKRKPVLTTAGGVTHRLTWADRNAGWRMRCSCGWLDPKLRWTENNAVWEGNRHALAARRPPKPRSLRREIPPGGYSTLCLKCNKKVDIENPHYTTINKGRPVVAGSCPTCGTTIYGGL
jgi:Domain of unknown function (DUF5679)